MNIQTEKVHSLEQTIYHFICEMWCILNNLKKKTKKRIHSATYHLKTTLVWGEWLTIHERKYQLKRREGRFHTGNHAILKAHFQQSAKWNPRDGLIAGNERTFLSCGENPTSVCLLVLHGFPSISRSSCSVTGVVFGKHYEVTCQRVRRRNSEPRQRTAAWERSKIKWKRGIQLGL